MDRTGETSPSLDWARIHEVVFEHSVDGIVLFDDAGRYLEANPAAAGILARPTAVLRGMTFEQVSDSARRHELAAALSSLLAAGALIGEWTIVRPDGEKREVEFRAVARVMPQVHMAVLRDITERKRMETALRESEMRYRLLFEGSPVPSWAFDRHTYRIRLFNQAVLQMYGYGREELSEMSVLNVRRSEDVEDFIRHVANMRMGEIARVHTVHRRKDGSFLNVEIFHHLVHWEGREHVVALINELTGRQQLQAQRDAFQSELRAVAGRLATSQEVQRRDIAADLHDRVGQTLSGLAIRLALLEQTIMAPEKRQAMVESRQILEEAMASVRAVISALRPTILTEHGLCAGLRDLTEQARRRFGLDVSIRGHSPEKRLAREVEAAIFRIAQEALVNAAKHAGTKAVQLTFSARRGRAILIVGDKGRGFNAGRLATEAREGRWGLLMMMERAESIGARLRIFSRPGRGTSIVVTWRSNGDSHPAGG